MTNEEIKQAIEKIENKLKEMNVEIEQLKKDKWKKDQSTEAAKEERRIRLQRK
jgi:uncharacterized protein YfkK (UPF0435 family)